MALTLAAARRGACRSADLAAQPGPSRPLPLSGSGRRNTAEIWRSPIYANVGGDRSRRCIPESDVLRGQSRPAWPAAAFAVSREVFASREVKASCCHGECAKSFECYLRFETAADHSRILDPWIRREVRSSDSAASVLVIGPSVAVRPQAQGRLRRRRRRRVAAIVTRDRRAVCGGARGTGMPGPVRARCSRLCLRRPEFRPAGGSRCHRHVRGDGTQSGCPGAVPGRQ